MKKVYWIYLASLVGLAVAAVSFNWLKLNTDNEVKHVFAQELYDEFVTDKQGALERYRGEVLEISGKVNKIAKVASGRHYFNFLIKGEGTVRCVLVKDFDPNSLDGNKWEEFTLRGECIGYVDDVLIADAQIIVQR